MQGSRDIFFKDRRLHSALLGGEAESEGPNVIPTVPLDADVGVDPAVSPCISDLESCPSI
jgi:hypothetical protein